MRAWLLKIVLLFLGASILRADWKQEANTRIEKFRKGDFTLHVVDEKGKPVANAAVRIHQTRSDFHFGVALAESLVGADSDDSRNYEKFVLAHFNTVVCENSMKWYSTEKERDNFTYETADRMAAFAGEHGLAMRGHCLFWAKKKYVQQWVQDLGDGDLRAKMDEHLDKTVNRYNGKVISWDVDNEMLDGAYYEERLGRGTRAAIFKKAHALDGKPLLFVNEYGIFGSDEKTARYVELIRSLQASGAPVGGIGIQEHAAECFVASQNETGDTPERRNRAALIPEDVWRRLDKLGELGLPIQLTEISAKTSDPERRADALEALFRTGFAHPKVEAILLWGFWEKAHWLGRDAALVDKDWHMLPAGERISKLLLEEWRTNLDTKTDALGNIAFRGFYGTYEVAVLHHGVSGTTEQTSLTPQATKAEVTLHK